MSKISALKEKLGPLIAAIEKIKGKIPFLKAKKTEQKATQQPVVDKKIGLAEIYREGSTFTRFTVILIFLLSATFLISSGYLSVRIIKKMRKNSLASNSQQQLTDQFQHLSKRISDAASIVSLGTVVVNHENKNQKEVYINVDLWVKCDSPDTAAQIQKYDIRLLDLAIDAIKSILSLESVSFLTDDGKEKAKAEIIRVINKALHDGKILEVYFHNLTATELPKKH